MSKYITPNQREGITAYDPITQENFYLEGTSATGSLNVNAVITPGGTQDTNLIKVGGTSISLGQTTMSASLPVTIASNQTALSVSAAQSGTWNINNISGTISLPTGASTLTAQNTGNTSLSSIDGKTPALGQALAAASVPVVLTAAQLSTLTPLSTVAATQSGAWSVTANAGTNLNTSALALASTQTDKSQFTKLTDGTDTALITSSGELNVLSTAQPGTDIGDVTVNNGSGAGAVNIQDGGNSITIDGTVSVTGVATASNQTSGAQLTQIVDSGGEAVTVTGGKLDVNATISGSGGGTSSIDNTAFAAGSDSGTPTMGFYHSTIDTVTDGDTAVIGMTSKRGLFVNLQTAAGAETGVAATPLQVSLANTASNATAVKVDGSAVTQPVSGSVTANAGTNLNTSLLALASTQTDKSQFTKITDGTDTALITASGELNVLATAQPGTDIGDVTVNNAAGASAVNIQDGGNSITVDYATTGSGTATGALRVELPTNGTGVVGLNAGTNAIGKLTANSGVIIGDVNVVNSNVSTNLAQVNGATTLAGNGTSGTGAQRVTVASDSTGQIAPAANATATGTAIYNNTALSSTKQAVNASAGNLYGYHVYNPNSVVIYIQLFNVASAGVTVGTTAPTAVIAVPPGGWADATPGVPIAFATALTIAATTTSTGSGTPTTALLFNCWYK